MQDQVKTSGRSGRNFRLKAALAALPCSIWRSAASLVAVVSLRADKRRIGRPSGRRKPSFLFKA
jgi:hypothetical protein